MNVRNKAGQTPLLRVVATSTLGERTVPVVRLLLWVGADPNLSDHRGVTPLMAAVRAPSPSQEVFAALLEAGASPNAKDARGDTVAHLLAACAHPRALAMLESAVAFFEDPSAKSQGLASDVRLDLNARNAAGLSPLHVAVSSWANALHLSPAAPQRRAARRAGGVDAAADESDGPAQGDTRPPWGASPSGRVYWRERMRPASGRTPSDPFHPPGADEVVAADRSVQDVNVKPPASPAGHHAGAPSPLERAAAMAGVATSTGTPAPHSLEPRDRTAEAEVARSSPLRGVSPLHLTRRARSPNPGSPSRGASAHATPSASPERGARGAEPRSPRRAKEVPLAVFVVRALIRGGANVNALTGAAGAKPGDANARVSMDSRAPPGVSPGAHRTSAGASATAPGPPGMTAVHLALRMLLEMVNKAVLLQQTGAVELDPG